ncbi:MerR family transcriptional regulator [Bacillus sp. BB56-3]|nr:MerR family transcriptional regulator [Bacillus sp. BB56-3]
MKGEEGMINEFRHLDEGYTVIYCPDAETQQMKEVYIETEDFSKIDIAIKGAWKSWKRDKKKFIGGVDGRKAINLARLIMGIDNKLKHVLNLTDNPYDLRKCNLIVINCGDNQKSDVRSKIEELKRKVPPILKIQKEKPQASMQQQLVLHNDEGGKYLNRAEAAENLGIAKSTINYWIKRNNLSVKRDEMGKVIYDDELMGKLKEIKDTAKLIRKEKVKKEDSAKQQNPQKQDIRILKDYKTNDYLLVEIESAGTLSVIKKFNKKQIEQLRESFSNILL